MPCAASGTFLRRKRMHLSLRWRLAAGIVLAGMRALAMRQIGGQTGDVCGAVQVLTELAMLTVYAATIG